MYRVTFKYKYERRDIGKKNLIELRSCFYFVLWFVIQILGRHGMEFHVFSVECRGSVKDTNGIKGKSLLSALRFSEYVEKGFWAFVEEVFIDFLRINWTECQLFYDRIEKIELFELNITDPLTCMLLGAKSFCVGPQSMELWTKPLTTPRLKQLFRCLCIPSKIKIIFMYSKENLLETRVSLKYSNFQKHKSSKRIKLSISNLHVKHSWQWKLTTFCIKNLFFKK